jgi:TRAP-type mannitol/chloroaromatic compound transport system substrate-binding protein
MRRLVSSGAHDIYDNLSKINPHFIKLYESLVPYRNDAYAWLQGTEIGFDSFQIRMRARS